MLLNRYFLSFTGAHEPLGSRNFARNNINFDNFQFFSVTDSERRIIEHYFHLGYKYDIIICLLKNEHGIQMDLRTLKRRLKFYNLNKRKDTVSEDHIRNIVRNEMQGPGCLAGYVDT